jgi:hypothetical protein
MSTMTCFSCFAQFRPAETYFRCPMHPGERFLFPYRSHSWWPVWKPPRQALCPRDALVTGFRVCPNPRCHAELPYFIGSAPQHIVAVTGCGGTGKTVYLWSLLHQMREVLTRAENPFAVAMFEDDTSFRMYQQLCQRIQDDRRVPDFTDAQVIREENRIPPVIVRVMTKGERRAALDNLVFYDPAGELFENLSDKCYLRYLAGPRESFTWPNFPKNLLTRTPTPGPCAPPTA